MNSQTITPNIAASAATGCPMHAAPATNAALQKDDWLVFPMHKKVIAQYSTDENGSRELHLYYGDKEISFDEPELFVFGETLALQSRFVAESATTWGGGYDWSRVGDLLEQLITEGILEYANAWDAAQTAEPSRDGVRTSPLPLAATTTPRTWFDCEDITRELTGQSIELAYLELVIPIFRIAHMALDTEGRQVGEANVFPKALRLDVPTQWRACIYAGSRYQDERPMNVSALKSMRVHWPQMMVALFRLRESYFRRFPSARNGWTIGDVERLSTLVLALPTYMLMKEGQRVDNGALHPVMSSLFRVTDGLRMTTHQMLFVPVAEATLSPLAPTSSREIYEYAERNHAFASTHGVCAGPQSMIEEFLRVVIDGVPVRGAEAVVLDAPVVEALACVEQAFDYGLLGLQAHAVVFSLWPVMTRTYAQLFQIAQAWSGERSPAAAKLTEHLQAKVQILKNETLHATEAWRVNREQVYADIHEQCALGLGIKLEKLLPQLINSPGKLDHSSLNKQLKSLLQRQLLTGAQKPDANIDRMVECLMTYFLKARAILDVACEIQERINALLGRSVAKRAFSAADIDIHVLLQGSEARRLPHLLNELENLLGFRAVITRDAIDIQDPQHDSMDLLSVESPQFASTVLADNRAICTAH